MFIRCYSIFLPSVDLSGLFPVVFNLATRARIEASATCGETASEMYCKLVEHVPLFTVQNPQCDICDARSSNPSRRHPISNSIDGSKSWWQSPTLTNGDDFNRVTVTLDLGQVGVDPYYHCVFVTLNQGIAHQ